MKVTILGAGAYGLALATMVNENSHNITIWTKLDNELEELKKYHTNNRVLPDFVLPNNFEYTNNLKKAVKNSDLIIIAVPAGFVDSVSKELSDYYENQPICIASKGIEQDTCLFVDDVVKKYIKTDRIAVISGPSFAIDIIKKVPIGLSLATNDDYTEKVVINALQNNYLKLRTTDDIIGIEICGSVKNIIAIAAGMIDGMGLPESTQAMFITESLHDIKELIKALGGNKNTILSFAGFGDLLLTATSIKSRNFRFGKMIGENNPKELIEEFKNNTTIEGLYTLKSIYKLLDNKKVNIPIINLIYDIIFNDENPNEIKEFLIKK